MSDEPTSAPTEPEEISTADVKWLGVVQTWYTTARWEPWINDPQERALHQIRLAIPKGKPAT